MKLFPICVLAVLLGWMAGCEGTQYADSNSADGTSGEQSNVPTDTSQQSGITEQNEKGKGNADARSEDPDLLGFDATQIPDPDAQKGEPVARVFYEYIYPENFLPPGYLDKGDQQADSEQKNAQQQADRASMFELTDERLGSALQSIILSRLQKRYAERHGITATQEEIDEFNEVLGTEATIKRLHEDLAQAGDSLTSEQKKMIEQSIKEMERMAAENEQGEDKEDPLLQMFKDRGRSMVTGWKFDRALYKEYGGIVIFQQTNPMEPVGAYRQFLEEMEAGDVFEIFDENVSKEFWSYYKREDHGAFQVDPDDVNFDKPPWKQIPSRNN